MHDAVDQRFWHRVLQAAIKIIKKSEIQTRIWIETDRKIYQGMWTEGQQRNNQKLGLHESGVEVEMLETKKGAEANRRSEEKTVVIRAAA